MALTNNNKMMEAVLIDEDLMKYGRYDFTDIRSILDALDSDNVIVNAVAHIIQRADEECSQQAIYKEVNDYLKRNI